MIKAVIFDFDGVIADSEMIHFRAFNAALEKYGILLDLKKYWSEYLGFTDKEAYQQIKKDNNLDWDNEKIEWLIDEKAVFFDEIVAKEGVIIDGVMDFIAALKDYGMTMAICSGATGADIESVFRATQKRAGINMREFFEVVITADDVKNGKPSPEGYTLTLKKLNTITNTDIKPSEVIVIEDSHWGIEAGKAAGMIVAAVTNSYKKEELTGEADIVVDNLRELKDSKVIFA